MECAIVTCKNYYKKTLYMNVVYHSFPKNNATRKVWVTKCKRDGINVKNACICSDHFCEEDYNRDLQHELLGLPIRKRGFLKPDAIPTQNMPGQSKVQKTDERQSSEAMSKRKARVERRQIRKRALDRIASLPLKETADKDTSTTDLYDFEKLVLENAFLKKENQELKARVTQTHIFYKNKLALLRENTAKRNQLPQKKKMKEMVKMKLDEALSKVFTAKQIQCLISGKRNTNVWDERTIKKALALRALSARAYVYLRKAWHVPLPAVATLKRWTQHFCCQPEILQSQPEILQCQPDIVQNQPKIIQSQPEFLQSQPEILQNQPEILQNQPEILQNQPEILQNQPEILQNQPQILQCKLEILDEVYDASGCKHLMK